MIKDQAIKHLKLMQSGARNAIRYTKNDKEISEEERKEDIEIYQDQLEALEIAIEALEQELNYKSFCLFVAKTIMDEDFELNAGANAEIFCRKLAELGIVKADGDRWVLESEVSE